MRQLTILEAENYRGLLLGGFGSSREILAHTYYSDKRFAYTAEDQNWSMSFFDAPATQPMNPWSDHVTNAERPACVPHPHAFLGLSMRVTVWEATHGGGSVLRETANIIGRLCCCARLEVVVADKWWVRASLNEPLSEWMDVTVPLAPERSFSVRLVMDESYDGDHVPSLIRIRVEMAGLQSRPTQ